MSLCHLIFLSKSVLFQLCLTRFRKLSGWRRKTDRRRETTHVPIREVRGIRDHPLQTETGTHRRLPACLVVYACLNGSWQAWKQNQIKFSTYSQSSEYSVHVLLCLCKQQSTYISIFLYKIAASLLRTAECSPAQRNLTKGLDIAFIHHWSFSPKVPSISSKYLPVCWLCGFEYTWDT